MNLPQFLKLIDDTTSKMTKETLAESLHNIARTLPEERREWLLSMLSSDYIEKTESQETVSGDLYKELEKRLTSMGYKFMYGVITDDNDTSIAFHKALGFEEVGHFTDIGYKFGNWKGIVWYRKQIGSLTDMPQ